MEEPMIREVVRILNKLVAMGWITINSSVSDEAIARTILEGIVTAPFNKVSNFVRQHLYL
jgi:hypothetical protein